MLTRFCCIIALGAIAITNASGVRQKLALFHEGFDDSHLTDRGWYDGGAIKISNNAPHSGAGCIEFHWKPATTVPDSSSALRHLFAPTDTVFVRFYIRLSKGWSWSGRLYHPHLMHFMTTENDKYRGPASSHLTVYIEPHDGKLRLAAQDIENEHAVHGLTQGPLRGGYNGKEYDSRDAPLNDDQWHCVEAMFKLNSLDMKADKPIADGAARGWVDGKLVIDRSDLILRSTDFPNMKSNQYLLAPYFGDGLLPHEQTLWIDELVVGTERIGPSSAQTNTSGDAAQKHRSFASEFGRAESSIAENGNWINGKAVGIDWADVRSTHGHAFGTETGRIKYDDSTALLSGSWRPDQTAEAKVFTTHQSERVFEEVELRLRSALSAHRATGYEINFRCLKAANAYCQIVRWNGPLGDFTYVGTAGGAEFGVTEGDIVRATIVGNVITAYINDKQVLSATDSTFKTGSPGMGFYLEGDPALNADFGFTRFAAWD